ncbi:MAG: ribose 5-phosphate isomerase B [Alphaproteobacteria bacterium]|nr:ribose 5-phosphate isomerase B [Alphaproteobacteria bacterium]
MCFKTIAIASDHRGYWLKNDIIHHFQKSGFNIKDFGTDNDCISVDYPDFAKSVAKYVKNNDDSCGILICHSGIGMSIAANRMQGIRAALCYTQEHAKLSREHNDANIICIGAGFVNTETAIELCEIFVHSKLEDNRHMKRIQKIEEA